ncbi:MAG: hypothetical protein ACLQVF_16680 [Isosphaeraceae bacterium]
MDSGIARKSAVSRWLLTFMVGLGVLASVSGLWCYKLDYEARQRAQAADREARLAALRAEAEAQRVQAERQIAKVKSAERVGQLYREIDNLTHLGERVQTSLRHRPRTLESSEQQPQVTP